MIRERKRNATYRDASVFPLRRTRVRGLGRMFLYLRMCVCVCVCVCVCEKRSGHTHTHTHTHREREREKEKEREGGREREREKKKIDGGTSCGMDKKHHFRDARSLPIERIDTAWNLALSHKVLIECVVLFLRKRLQKEIASRVGCLWRRCSGSNRRL